MNRSVGLPVLAVCTLLMFSGLQINSDKKVSTLEEFDQAVKSAQPGDKIVMAAGIWRDVELVFEGHGTKTQPITLTAEKEGEVIISGLSNLSLAGEYLIVSGLVFKNGRTPTGEVISFQKNKNAVANHCTVKQCVIDNYNNPERFEPDLWVSMYGKHNSFEYNSLIDKRNQGVTLAVRLDNENSRENYHRIANNYFGPRDNLGSNGGETIRIGTSHFSLSNSNTIVENNYFDRCNGEHETISNKSGNNIYRGNVFYECVGTLTLRHGKYTLVENNYFLGNGVLNTGGIRVINEYQTVRHNYLSGLTGFRFRGALVVMNGIYNSPINRYNQVVDSKIENNLVINCDYIQLCAGSDDERTAVPVGTSFSNNVFMSNTNKNPFTIYDDISGITFKNNFINEDATLPIQTGFEKVKFGISKNQFGLEVPDKKLLKKIGFDKVQLPITQEQAGASYYPKVGKRKTFGGGKIIPVIPGTNTILSAMASAQPGDVLLLQNAGEYLFTKDCKINKPISIKSNAGEKAIIRSSRAGFFQIENEGSLELVNVNLDGAESPDQAGNYVISTSKYSMNKNYKLFIRDCSITDLTINYGFNFFKIAQHTLADSVVVQNSTFKDITGQIFSFDKEIEDLGIYNVETVLIENCRFENVQGVVANIYRGGTDESTYGPWVNIRKTQLINCGKGVRNKLAASLSFHGVQNLRIEDTILEHSAPVKLYLTNGDPITLFKNVALIDSGEIISNSNNYTKENTTVTEK